MIIRTSLVGLVIAAAVGIAAWGGERIACLDAVIASYPPLAYAYFFKANVFVARNALSKRTALARTSASPKVTSFERAPENVSIAR